MAGLKYTHPRVCTAQTNVLSPLILSVPILSVTLPLATSHFLKLLSEHPATIHESFHSSSSSSSLSSSSDFPPPLAVFRVLCLGMGGPQAILRILLFTTSSRRKWVRVPCSSESKRTAPSSQPMARSVDAGLGVMHHIEPPCEGRVLYSFQRC